MTILGDDLYCKQPLCEAFIREGLNFILVCKPDSHKTLYEWVAGLAATGDVQTLEVERRHGKHRYTDTYRFVSNVPLRDGEGALDVNWCELTTTRDDGKITYKNAFATNHPITETNVADIVRDGRARWKVEPCRITTRPSASSLTMPMPTSTERCYTRLKITTQPLSPIYRDTWTEEVVCAMGIKQRRKSAFMTSKVRYKWWLRSSAR